MCIDRRSNLRAALWPGCSRNARFSRPLVASGVLLLILLAGGCRSGTDGRPVIPFMPSLAEPEMTEQEVWNALSTYLDVYDWIIRSSADRVSAAAEDNRQRRAAVEWRINGLRLMRSAMKKEAPLAALLDAWTLTVQLQEYLKGRASEFPGPIQEIVQEATAACIEEVEKVAVRVLRQARFTEVREQVYTFARENPMAGGYSAATPRALSESRVEIPALKAVLSIPLAPFRAVQGIDSTAQAVHEFNKIAIRFADAAEDMPDSINSQLQLTLLDLAENDVAESALRSAERISESTERFVETAEQFAATADALPGRLRLETQGLVEDLSAKQAEFRQTIERVESATSTVDRAVQRVRETTPELAAAIENVETAGKSLTETAHAIREMVASFREDAGTTRPAGGEGAASRPVEGEGRAFDVREYDSAAQSIATAAKELKDLTERVRGMLEDKALQARIVDLDQRLAANIERAGQRAEAVASSLVFKGGGLLVVGFVLAMIYRLLTGRRTAGTAR